MKVSVYIRSTKCGCMICPNCKAHEIKDCGNMKDTSLDWEWQIRPFKVDNWSHCLKCNCWFDSNGKIEFDN